MRGFDLGKLLFNLIMQFSPYESHSCLSFEHRRKS